MVQNERHEFITRCQSYVAEMRDAARRHHGTPVGGLYSRMADDLSLAVREMADKAGLRTVG